MPPPLLCARLEEAYEEAIAALGGLQSAQPKLVLERLQGEFPDLTLQVGAGPPTTARLPASCCPLSWLAGAWAVARQRQPSGSCRLLVQCMPLLPHVLQTIKWCVSSLVQQLGGTGRVAWGCSLADAQVVHAWAMPTPVPLHLNRLVRVQCTQAPAGAAAA